MLSLSHDRPQRRTSDKHHLGSAREKWRVTIAKLPIRYVFPNVDEQYFIASIFKLFFLHFEILIEIFPRPEEAEGVLDEADHNSGSRGHHVI